MFLLLCGACYKVWSPLTPEAAILSPSSAANAQAVSTCCYYSYVYF